MTDFDLQGIGMTSQRTRDRLVARLREQGIDNNEVLACMGAVPRHIFVDEAMAHRSYEDTALPIGHNQTISQPFIVALMTQLLCEVKPRQVLKWALVQAIKLLCCHIFAIGFTALSAYQL